MHATFPLSLIAASGPEVPLPSSVPGLARDTLVILIAVSAVGLLLLGGLTLWVKSRRSRHRHHRHQHRRQTEPKPVEVADEEEAPNGSHRQRRRKRRREHRPRNPTLAETGGLPPPRPEGQVPPGL